MIALWRERIYLALLACSLYVTDEIIISLVIRARALRFCARSSESSLRGMSSCHNFPVGSFPESCSPSLIRERGINK